MTVQGKIKVINEVQVVSDKFRKRDIVVVTNDTYPQEISIQFTQDKCEILNGYVLGQEVEVSINLRGRCWTDPQGVDKYFNTIEGWKIQQLGQPSVPVETVQEQESDLPF